MAAVQHYSEFDLSRIEGTDAYRCVTSSPAPGQDRVLSGLGAVNLFVGPNNSGKSRFLRALFRAPSYVYRPSNFESQKVGLDVQELSRVIASALGNRVARYGPLSGPAHFAKFHELRWLTTGSNLIRELQDELRSLIATNDFGSAVPSSGVERLSEPTVREAHRSIVDQAMPFLQEIQKLELAIGQERRVYVPVLRGLRPIGPTSGPQGRDVAVDYYGDRTASDYGLKGLHNHDIVTGLTFYQSLRSLMLGTRDDRARVAQYEAFLGEALFDGRRVDLTPHEKSDVVYLNVDGQEERPIYALGDGMQALIILTFSAFTAPGRTLFFFEEPDTHLHPGMQRKLLEVFVRTPQLQAHQLFLTTHSNHLLDMAADYGECATFLFRPTPKTDNFEIRTMESQNRMVLEDLGVRASSVFLTNATIWVEGIADRLYLREYLAKFLGAQKRERPLREDTHYAFLEAGGSCVAHLDFAAESSTDELTEELRIASVCSLSLLVLDGDNRRHEARLHELKQALPGRLVVLDSKEIENLLPPIVLQAWIQKVTKGESGVTPRLEDYHRLLKPLGAYLADLTGHAQFRDGQTVRNKMSLCRFAVS